MEVQHDTEDSLLSILQHHVLRLILECMDPGSALKFSATCKRAHEAVKENADGYWRARCAATGWVSEDAAGQACPQSSWFVYYCARMATRWRIRHFVKLYLPFMSRASQMNLNPGASPGAIAATEQRLGVSLPWELWELYRFRDGQAPGSGVRFTEDVRLLMLQELSRETVQDVTGQYGLARLQAIEQVMSRVSTSDLPQNVPGSVAMAGEAKPDMLSSTRDVIAVRILQDGSGFRCFLVDLDTGCVLQRRGLSTFLVSLSLSSFMQRLLT